MSDDVEDKLAREMISNHIDSCKEDRGELRKMFDQIWSALDDMRIDRRKITQKIIWGLLAGCVSLIGYIWVTALSGVKFGGG